MTGLRSHWLLTASLLGVLVSPPASLAQAGRPWVDPPPEGETRSQTPAPPPAAAPAQTAAPAQPPAAPPAPAPSTAQAAKSAGETAEDAGAQASSRKPANEEQAKQKIQSDRKARSPSQQAGDLTRSQKREERVVRRREPDTTASHAQPRNGAERRARILRYGSAQEGADAGLQVMRLRTIQLPDGRRIDILTRPDQDLPPSIPDAD